jgi:7,8-dihydro-6-hydroxymethylpterin-pyrophosphokinase
LYKFLFVSAIALEVWLISSQLDSPAWAEDNQEQFINLQTTVQNLEMITDSDRSLLLATPDVFNPNLRDRTPTF